MSLTKNDRKIQSRSGNMFPSGSFAEAIAGALHREYDQRHAGVKTVVTLTGANERAVRNWFDAKNGPNGEFPQRISRHHSMFLVWQREGENLRARGGRKEAAAASCDRDVLAPVLAEERHRH